MERKQLEELGLEKDVINKIMDLNGNDINKVKQEKEVLEQEKTNLSEQLKSANTKIEDFSKLNVDEIKEEAKKYKEEFEANQKEMQNKLKQQELEHKIELSLTKQGAKSIKAAKALLDIDKLNETDKVDEELEAQLTNLTESASYLFQGQQTQGKNIKIIDKTGQANNYTNKEDILNIKDGVARRQAIKDNINLFE